MSKLKDIVSQIEEIKEDICDNYCKFPQEYSLKYEDSEIGHDVMIDDVCSECPLCRL